MSVVKDKLMSICRSGGFLVVIVVACVGAVLAVWHSTGTTESAPSVSTQQISEANPPVTSTVLVFVSGAVVQPGLYHLAPDARVTDAIAAAGGMTSAADPAHLPNLSERVHDGRQVNVPFVKSGSSSSSVASRADLNSATLGELSAIPGMPQGLPDAIIEYRTQWGGFTSVSDLTSALGVDKTTLSLLRPYVRVLPP